MDREFARQIVEEQKTAAGWAAQQLTAPAPSFCAGCGKQHAAADAFCTGCGKRK